MIPFYPIAFVLVLFLQGNGIAPVAGDFFHPTEKARFEKAKNVEGRIKVYETASKRIQQALEASITKDDLQLVPKNLNLWSSLLAQSLEDIEANLKTKKKPRALINYEIQIRKSIASMENFRTRVPVEQQDALDACLTQAEKVRKKFVEILFLH